MSRIDELRTAFETAREATLGTLTTLTDEQWGTEVQSEGEHWTVAHVVAHLVDTEMSQAMLITRLREGEPTVPEDFDIDRWNARVRKMPERGRDDLMAALEETHAGMLGSLSMLSDDDLAVTGRHPGLGEVVTLERFLEVLAWHEGHHLGEIRSGLGIDT